VSTYKIPAKLIDKPVRLEPMFKRPFKRNLCAAVSALLGHVDNRMARVYRERISENCNTAPSVANPMQTPANTSP
jgi:hypothetical protein